MWWPFSEPEDKFHDLRFVPLPLLLRRFEAERSRPGFFTGGRPVEPLERPASPQEPVS